MRISKVFTTLFKVGTSKVENNPALAPKTIDFSSGKNDKIKTGLVIEHNQDSSLPNDRPLEEQMSPPQGQLWRNPDSVLPKSSVESNIFNIHTVEGIPVDPKLNFNTDDGKFMLKAMTFDSTTFQNTPKENLPQGWNPDEIIEQGRSIGQNSDRMHKMGYTGKNINVAVIDQPIILHDDLKSSLVEYNKMQNVKQQNTGANFHGQAVSDILVGDKDGVAPDAGLVYYATTGVDIGKPEKDWTQQDMQKYLKTFTDDQLSAMHKIIEHNQNAKTDKDKIRVVSLSWGVEQGGYRYDEYKQMLNTLYKDGVFVVTCGKNMVDGTIEGENLPWNAMDKKDQKGNQNEFSNYVSKEGQQGKPEETLCILSGDRTVASAKDPTKYRHDSVSCASWAAPALAGIYTCALQCADENGVKLTPKLFWEYAAKTGVEVKDDKGNLAGKAIDCEALCKYIKNQGTR